MKHNKIAIFGAGAVGSSIAYAVMLRNIAAEVMLVDIDTARCKGEILDLSDALPFCSASSIHSATPTEAAQADIIIISAGSRQKSGQSRTDLAKINLAVMRTIFEQMKPVNQNAVIIMVSNPVDLLTLYAHNLKVVPAGQVLGSGTFLDTQRLRGTIAQHVGCAEQSIQAYILGEHGDTQFPAWSSVSIGGMPLKSFSSLTQKMLDTIAEETKHKAYEIIACKDATHFGIAACVGSLCKAILFNQKRILPISSFIPDLEVSLSLPTVIGERGVEQVMQLPLNTQEEAQLKQSAEHLKAVWKACSA